MGGDTDCLAAVVAMAANRLNLALPTPAMRPVAEEEDAAAMRDAMRAAPLLAIIRDVAVFAANVANVGDWKNVGTKARSPGVVCWLLAATADKMCCHSAGV